MLEKGAAGAEAMSVGLPGNALGALQLGASPHQRGFGPSWRSEAPCSCPLIQVKLWWGETDCSVLSGHRQRTNMIQPLWVTMTSLCKLLIAKIL